MQKASIGGLKITHDSAVALIRGGNLVCAIELEKVSNNPRYARFERLEQVTGLLSENGMDPRAVDSWVVDGWFTETRRTSDPTIHMHDSPSLVVLSGGERVQVPVATYREPDGEQPLDGVAVSSAIPGVADSYHSHHHSTGHLASGFCASPFAAQERVTAVLVWDGGMAPRLYVVDARSRIARSLGQVLPLKGNAYVEVVARFPPFRLPDDADESARQRHQLSAPGKAMAYAGLGAVDHELYAEISQMYTRLASDAPFVSLPIFLAEGIEKAAHALGTSAADALQTWQAFLGSLLEEELAAQLARHGLAGAPLVLAGGCALNITWNSALRDSGRFGDVWVPPFPNDSGSAIGAACAEMMRAGGPWVLEWDVYRGGPLREEPIPSGWSMRAAGLTEVAELLNLGHPVMFLHGNAELGPRALGHRSILASATDRRMVDVLNSVKRREPYRPVAPICREERATEIFDPGGRDPYMLFQHRVRPAWAERIPAVCHADGTARLQTVSREQEPTVYELLSRYERLSGVPVLCNTSANYPGRGFFPSVGDALRWGGVAYAWSEGRLYSRDSREGAEMAVTPGRLRA